MGESVKYDKPLISILLPLVGWPIGEVNTQIMKYFGLTNLSAFEALSLMLLREPSWFLGILAAFLFNAWLSLIIYHLPKILGPDHFPFKCMLVTMTGESLLFNIFGILGKNERMIQSLSGNYVHSLAAGFGGWIAGLLVKKYLFDRAPNEETRVGHGGTQTKSNGGRWMRYDEPLHAMLFGIIPAPLFEGFTQIMKHLGFTRVSTFEALSLLWLREPSWLLGILAVVGIGAWFGVIVYHSTKILGSDYLTYKALLIVISCQFLIFSIFGNLGGNQYLIQNAGGQLVHAAAAAIWGSLTGFLMRRYVFERMTRF